MAKEEINHRFKGDLESMQGFYDKGNLSAAISYAAAHRGSEPFKSLHTRLVALRREQLLLGVEIGDALQRQKEGLDKRR